MIDPATMPERCYTMLKSLNEFDKQEIRGIVRGLLASTFNLLAAKQNKLAGECYIVLLTTIIDEFRIDIASTKVRNKLKLAKILPFADDAEEVQALERELLA